MTADLRLCSLTDLDLEPGSVDAIITDPPYPREFLPLWGDLAVLASRVLRPGGALLAMSGQIALPSVMSFMSGGILVYRWTLCVRTPGAEGRVWPIRLSSGWKPILWYTQGDRDLPRDWITDTFKSPMRDKRFHGWGQSLGVFEHLVRTFSRRNDVICDPFLGGGTTAAAAILNGRRFVGCDIDETCIRKTEARLAAVDEYLATRRRVVSTAADTAAEPLTPA